MDQPRKRLLRTAASFAGAGAALRCGEVLGLVFRAWAFGVWGLGFWVWGFWI